MNIEPLSHKDTKNIDGFVKSQIFPFIWIPAYAGMTIKHLISIRYTIRHTRECGYPDVKKLFTNLSIKNGQ